MSAVKRQTPTRNSKMLTFDSIAKDGKKYDKKTKVTLEDGQFTYIYKNLSNVKIDDMLDNFGKFVAEYNKNHGDMSESKTLDYLNLHILSEFSELTGGVKYSFEEKILVFEQVLKSGISEEIFDHFDKEEIGKVYERVFKKLESYQELAKSNKEVQEKLREHVMNSNVENKEEILNVLLSDKRMYGLNNETSDEGNETV